MIKNAPSAISVRALAQLSDNDLLERVRVAVDAERRATADLVALLMELDERRLYLQEGYSSLFTYCTQALHLAEHAAYNRIETARAARQFPLILALLANGAVTLTAIRLLAPHLTTENHRELLERSRHKSKREVELIVASIQPQPDVPSVIRKLPSSVLRTSSIRTTHVAPTPEETDARDAEASQAEISPVAPSPRQANVKPLTSERYKVQFTVSRETYDKLRRAQDLLRHSVPNGDPGVVFERALTLLVAHLERTKTAATSRPRSARSASVGSRHIAAAVKRAVWKRDAGRCAFKGGNGRCSETGFLEYHHVTPFATGGEASVENIELRCRAHNQHEARLRTTPHIATARQADEYFRPKEAPLLRESCAVYRFAKQLVLERVRM